ncbi:hypothetical protein B0H13DRAFT_1859498 [Mycena leptocephala]|nr:hypothetical protein B0H13DRAFT_1859498 [Mycena leptocephala]
MQYSGCGNPYAGVRSHCLSVLVNPMKFLRSKIEAENQKNSGEICRDRKTPQQSRVRAPAPATQILGSSFQSLPVPMNGTRALAVHGMPEQDRMTGVHARVEHERPGVNAISTLPEIAGAQHVSRSIAVTSAHDSLRFTEKWVIEHGRTWKVWFSQCQTLCAADWSAVTSQDDCSDISMACLSCVGAEGEEGRKLPLRKWPSCRAARASSRERIGKTFLGKSLAMTIAVRVGDSSPQDRPPPPMSTAAAVSICSRRPFSATIASCPSAVMSPSRSAATRTAEGEDDDGERAVACQLADEVRLAASFQSSCPVTKLLAHATKHAERAGDGGDSREEKMGKLAHREGAAAVDLCIPLALVFP